jgi:hypothetical protein
MITIDLMAAYRGYHRLPPEQQLLEPYVPLDVKLPGEDIATIIWWDKLTQGPIPSDRELQAFVLEGRRNRKPG